MRSKRSTALTVAMAVLAGTALVTTGSQATAATEYVVERVTVDLAPSQAGWHVRDQAGDVVGIGRYLSGDGRTVAVVANSPDFTATSLYRYDVPTGASSLSVPPEEGIFVYHVNRQGGVAFGARSPEPQGFFVQDTVASAPERLTVTPAGTPATGLVDSHSLILSTDGRLAFFDARSTELGGTTDGDVVPADIYVRDRNAGTTTPLRLSFLDRNYGCDSSNWDFEEFPSGPDLRVLGLSADANRLLLRLKGDFGGFCDIGYFVYDRTADTITELLTNSPAAANPLGVWEAFLSADGRTVFFDYEDFFDQPDCRRDIYAEQVDTGVTTTVVDVPGQNASLQAVSPDGRHVLYTSSSIQPAPGGSCELGRLSRVIVRDVASGTDRLVDVPSGGGNPNEFSQALDLSDDGQTVLFFSQATNLGGPGLFISRPVNTPEPPDPGGASMERLAGEDRIATGIVLSQQIWPTDGAGAVVLARSDTFPDALVGVPLAHHVGGPLLLTPSDNLDSRVLEEIRRVLPAGGHVHMLGGPGALSPNGEAELRAAGFTVVRHAGEDRFETALVVAAALGSSERVFLATGRNFPDALAAGTVAALNGGTVLLTDDETVPASVAAYLAGASQVVAVGGPAARAVPGAEPIVGTNRYATAVLLAQTYFDGFESVGLATGENFPDALAGGAHIARHGGPLLLTPSQSLDVGVAGLLGQLAEEGVVYAYGGTSALSDGVLADVEDAMG